jgi:hypothetical protein
VSFFLFVEGVMFDKTFLCVLALALGIPTLLLMAGAVLARTLLWHVPSFWQFLFL